MNIDHNTLIMGVFFTPFFIIGILSFFIVKTIHKASLCKKCGDKTWLIEKNVVESDDKIINRLIFKCVTCGHIRSEYQTKVLKKEEK